MCRVGARDCLGPNSAHGKRANALILLVFQPCNEPADAPKQASICKHTNQSV